MQARYFFTIMLLISFFCPGPLPAKSELPHEFGERVPVYPSAQPVDTRYTRNSVTVTFTTGDSYEKISGYYTKALEDAGWLGLPPTPEGEIKAEKVDAKKNDMELTIKEFSAAEGHSSGFIIEIYYPGGRE